MWGLFTIYGNYEPGLLFVDGQKWKNGTLIRGRREYSIRCNRVLITTLYMKLYLEPYREFNGRVYQYV